MKHKLLHFVMIGKKMAEYKKSMLLDPIYQRDNSGNIRVWRAEVGYDDDTRAAYRVHSGIFDGKTVTSEWKRSNPKNVGKANETSAFVQAQLEASSARNKKLDSGYYPDIGAIDDDDKPFKPMLAQTYDEDKFDWERMIFAQPKLDGIRCIATKKGLFTRAGKPIVSCPHIWGAIESIFNKDPNIVLDGELYNHELKDNFNEITSVVRKNKLSSDDFTKSANLIQYHIYDIYTEDEKDFTERLELITILMDYFSSPSIRLVDTLPVSNKNDLDMLYADMIEAGYEGQMIRINDVKYENKRSKSLLKRKEFLTDEFKVVNIQEGEGNWEGYGKRFVCELPDGTEFGAGVRGTQETLKELWESDNKPDWATVRYFTPTPDGIPRFPVVVDWGFGERDD